MTEILLPELPHSDMGPSSFDRVAECTAAAILARGMPGYSTPWGFEGTVLHHIWAECMLHGGSPEEQLGATFAPDPNPHDYRVEITREHVDALDEVLEQSRRFADGEFWVERKLTLPPEDRGIYGYADFIRLGRPLLALDLKFGFADVPGATRQIGIYILMALIAVEGPDYLLNGDRDEILGNAMIVQPRSMGETLKGHPWTRGDLVRLQAEIEHVHYDVRMNRIRYKVAPHCRYCRVAGVCPALRAAAQDAVMAEIVPFTDPAFDAEALDRAYKMLPLVKIWAERIKETAEDYMRRGGELKQAKIVRKQANREWEDKAQAEAFLRSHGVEPFAEPALLSPAQAEKKLPAAVRGETHPDGMLGLVTKPNRGLTIAPIEDPRPALTLTGARVEPRLREKIARDLISNYATTGTPK